MFCSCEQRGKVCKCLQREAQTPSHPPLLVLLQVGSAWVAASQAGAIYHREDMRSDGGQISAPHILFFSSFLNRKFCLKCFLICTAGKLCLCGEVYLCRERSLKRLFQGKHIPRVDAFIVLLLWEISVL